MALVGTPLNTSFISTIGQPVEAAYLNNGVAWASTAEALTDIPAGARYPYMIINVAGELYWFSADTTSLSAVKDTLLQTASEVPVEDLAENFLSKNVEDVLAEIATILARRENPFLIQLGAGQNVSDRLGAEVVPDGWTVVVGASPVDLDVNHNLSRRVKSVQIWAVNVDGSHVYLKDASAYSGLLDIDGDNFRIQGLGRVDKPLEIHIDFAL